MAILNSKDAERDAVLTIAKIMAASARTAPKTRGLDSVKTLILDGDDLEKLAKAMEERSKDDPERLAFFKRNADDVRKTMAILVIGVTGEPKRPELPLNCGACGHNCAWMLKTEKKDYGDARGPMCLMQGIDLGIALASACKMAADLNVDNRMMYSIGAAIRRMKLMEADLVVGIPLTVASKNPYFTGR
ncbi:MAG: DUF2148 domain-containing protein [Chloroflexota bacterium]